jgi:hypothetical protein
MTRLNLAGAATIAAGMLGGLPAGAADLGRPAPAAVDYVKVCDAHGAGFFYIPGSETCLRIGGYVRLDVDWAQKAFFTDPRLIARAQGNFFGTAAGYRAQTRFSNWNEFTTVSRARIDLDARTTTEWGLLRSVIKAEFQVGQYHEPIDPVSLAPRSLNIPTTVLREAYVQWGGLTAGRTYSLYNLPYFLTYSNPFTADQRVNMLGYTLRQGGFSASVAVEDPMDRRGYLFALSQADYNKIASGQPLGNNYGGFRYPDIVATAKFDNELLSLQASVAAHSIWRGEWDVAVTFPNRGGTPFTQNFGGGAIDEWGFAAQIGGQIKLNQRGSIYGGIAYTEGATAFSGIGADDDRLGGGVGFAVSDGGTRSGSNKFVPVKVWSGNIGAGYYVTETVRVAGSFGYADVKDEFRQGVPGLGIPEDLKLYRVLGLIEWSPAKDFTIGAEFGYNNVDFSNEGKFTVVPPAPTGKANYTLASIRDFDRASVLLRVQRRF